jgi:hypothetical protein
MSAVETAIAGMPPPKRGSATTGRDSLTIMLQRMRVISRRCPFFRIGRILAAYFFCVLSIGVRFDPDGRENTHSVPEDESTFNCVSSRDI